MSATSAITAERIEGKEASGLKLALFVIATAQLMLVLDDATANIALPSIQRDLGVSVFALPWIVNAYILAFGGLLLFGGRVGDVYGRKKVFKVGLIVFTLTSLLGGKVFLMLSRQALCQTKAAVPIKPFMYFYGIGTPALPFGCFVALRSLSHILLLLQHSSRQLLVSFRYASFISSFVSLPLHHVRSYPDASLHGFPPASTQKPEHGGKHIPFRKTSATILTQFH